MATQQSKTGRTTPKKKKGVTAPQDWKKSSQPLPEQELEVPSGNTCLVRPVGMEAFVTAGLIPNSLMSIVQEAMRSGTAPELNEDDVTLEQIQDMMGLFDAVVCFVVVQPTVYPMPDVEQREYNKQMHADECDANGLFKSRLYVEEVALEDKMFIFQFAVGGTRDLETFRQEQAAGLEQFRPVEGDGDQAEPPA